MAKFRIAHIREQGIDLIIAPLESSFGRQSDAAQHEFIEALQMCANSAGLAGTVVPVWLEGNGKRFIAPQNWHPFFMSLRWNDIIRNINNELTCS